MSTKTMKLIHVQIQPGTCTHSFKFVVPVKGKCTLVTRRQWVSRIACTEKKADENDDGGKTSTTLSSLERLLGKDEDEDVIQKNPAGM